MTRIVRTHPYYKGPPREPLFRMISLITLAVIAPAAADELQYGTYVCVTDRAVGIQTSASNDNERFAGNIILTPERQRFFVTIRKMPAEGFIRDGWTVHLSERCFSEETTKRLQRDWENNGKSEGGYQYPTSSDFQKWCLATSQLRIKMGDRKQDYYNGSMSAVNNNNLFIEEIFGGRFLIRPTGEFVWNFASDFRDQYMLEGRCELVK